MRIGSVTGAEVDIRMVKLPKHGHCVRLWQGNGRVVYLPVDMASKVSDAVIDGLELLERNQAER